MRPSILIVSSNVVSDAEMSRHPLSERRYMRLGPSGTGQRHRPTPIDTIKVETHPEWARSTGEKYARLHWCETCEQYTEWGEGVCLNCSGGADTSGLVPNASGIYYVWVLRQGSDEPLSSEGPYGPMARENAEQNARIGASNGIHDRAVSRGHDPSSGAFRIMSRYAARTGAQIA